MMGAWVFSTRIHCVLGCGLFWEVVTPRYLPRSVGDPWDVLAVWLGGAALLALWRAWDRPGHRR